MDERRAIQRQRVYQTGTIEFDGSAIDCTIRNVSPAGAALEVASPIGVPHGVTLYLPSRNARQHCYIVWRKEIRIGGVFAGKRWRLAPESDAHCLCRPPGS